MNGHMESMDKNMAVMAPAMLAMLGDMKVMVDHMDRVAIVMRSLDYKMHYMTGSVGGMSKSVREMGDATGDMSDGVDTIRQWMPFMPQTNRHRRR